jgi:DNA-binding transcriptional LysR family regulator
MPSSSKDNPTRHDPKAFAALDATRALYFSVVVEKNSVTLAAQMLGVSPSTVSRKLDDLEQRLGVRLVERDTRSLRLTEAGESYLHFVRKATAALDAGRQTMERYSSDLKGRLRVICPPAIGRHFVADLAIAFGRLHPFLRMSLELDSKPFSLSDNDFDVGLSVGMPSEDRAVVSKLGELTRGYVATSYFLQTHGRPNSLQSLAALPTCDVSYDTYLNDKVMLTNADGEVAYAPVKLATNDPEVGLRAVLSGELIGRVKHFYCFDELRSGALQFVMPELNDTEALYTVVSSRKGKPRKVQMFVDFLQAHLAPRLRAIEQQMASLTQAASKSGLAQIVTPNADEPL